VRYNPRTVRHLARILLNTLTVLSLVLCMATVALWARSHFVRDQWSYDAAHAGSPVSRAGWSGSSDQGQVALVRVWPILPLPPDDSILSPTGVPPGTKVQWEFPITQRQPWSRAGVTVREMWLNMSPVGPSKHVYSRAVLVHHWLIVLLTGAMPAWWLMRSAAHWRRRTQSRRRGLCPTCDYDVRATPDRCPECGTIAAR